MITMAPTTTSSIPGSVFGADIKETRVRHDGAVVVLALTSVYFPWLLNEGPQSEHAVLEENLCESYLLGVQLIFIY